MELSQVEGKDLLHGEDMLVASLSELKADFVVLQWHYFVRDESLLELNLSLALHVEAKEAGGEADGVLEVPLGLGLGCVSDEALRGGVRDCNTT